MSITAADIRDQDADPRREDQHRAEALEIERARATTAPEVRCDGGESDHAELRECETRDDDNAHAKGNLEQAKIAEAELEYPPVDVGDHVQDREDNSEKTMVVVRTPLEPANAIDARDGETVAECNPKYPADDDVIVVKFPERTSTDLGSLQGYAFPRTRLEVVAHVHDRDGDDGGAE
ncbi:hypothetical protein EL22_04110 [Halostagnicola sp. A56]|uniref:hypothetical protein n=1 Tax=Halostagnicola sp. A56 TaxID=1495067 RepID=UPI0004A00BBE|nr:hypothetical protein [Halostagnicola sp. A56]KDE58530.1 hypothetical protein EL22_04110 [Halostagnicola sp. A56]